MTTTYTMPGKIGDSLLQWPIPFWHHRETGNPIRLWLDEQTLKPLVTLYEAQPGVEAVELRPGIENWTCGGQPWHFGLKTDDLVGQEVHHLGFRKFPNRQITLEVRGAAALNLSVTVAEMSETPTLVAPDLPAANRLVIHGAGVATHNNQTPQVWRFLARIRDDLEARFDEISFVGSPDNRQVGLETYPEWTEFDDSGDFLKLASYLKASRLVIGMGSSVVALAGQLGVPSVRVHDPIGSIPKVIFSNLGKNQVNATETELRRLWPEFVSQHLEVPCPSVTP